MLRAPYFQLKKTNHHFIMTGIKYKTALMPLLLTALLSTTPAIHTDAAKNRKATTAKAEGTKAVKLLTENMKTPWDSARGPHDSHGRYRAGKIQQYRRHTEFSWHQAAKCLPKGRLTCGTPAL